MKKYIELDGSDVIQSGDEWKTYSNPDIWEPMPENLFGKKGWPIFTDCRRPIPYTGRVAFLANYSPMIRVEVDCTGLTEEEICQKISEEAKHKLWLNYKEYLDNFNDNIDWDNTKEDTECPAQLTLPTCCNHENEYGKRDYWDVFNVGNQGRIRLQVQRIDKPIDHDPLESDEIAWQLAKLAGLSLDENGFVL